MSTFAPVDNLPELLREKLASSGISEAEGEALGFRALSVEETAALGLWHLPSLAIPYRDPFTGAAMRPAPGWPDFIRYRALRAPPSEDKTFRKYLQPRDSGVCAYFPSVSSISGVSWPEILSNYQHSIIITEGELKAAKACLAGYPAIGLGGVWNFQSNAPTTEFLPELEKITWARRRVFIVFDSDLRTNPKVASAARALASRLVERGAVPFLTFLPGLNDRAKVGLDDYLMAHSVDQLELLLARSIPLYLGESLWSLNDRYAMLWESEQELLDLRTGTPVKVSHARLYETQTFDNGDSREKVIDLWLRWPGRQNVDRVIFDPSKPPLSILPNETNNTNSGYVFNTWKGWAVKPEPGDVSNFHHLIDHLFAGVEPRIRKMILQWFAYPIQHPGTKLLTSLILYGTVHGSGKTLLGYTMGKLYGSAFTTITQRDLTRDFNEWAANKAFILGDDITGSSRQELHDILKTMITQQEIRVNIKHHSPYTLADCINYMFTTNRIAGFMIDPGDRRFIVIEVLRAVGRLDRKFAREYIRWINNEGAAHLLHYLLTLDLTGFDPGAAAPDTLAKTKMREEAQSHVQTWCEDLANDDTGEMLASLNLSGDLFTPRQLALAYAAATGIREDDKTLIPQLSRALIATGFEQVNERTQIRFEGNKDRYYAVRNREKWAKAGIDEIRAHLKERSTKKGSKF